MARMSLIRYAIVAAVLVSALWAQNGVPPASTTKEPEAVGQSGANPDQLHPATLPETATDSTPPTATEVVRPVFRSLPSETNSKERSW